MENAEIHDTIGDGSSHIPTKSPDKISETESPRSSLSTNQSEQPNVQGAKDTLSDDLPATDIQYRNAGSPNELLKELHNTLEGFPVPAPKINNLSAQYPSPQFLHAGITSNRSSVAPMAITRGPTGNIQLPQASISFPGSERRRSVALPSIENTSTPSTSLPQTSQQQNTTSQTLSLITPSQHSSQTPTNTAQSGYSSTTPGNNQATSSTQPLVWTSSAQPTPTGGGASQAQSSHGERNNSSSRGHPAQITNNASAQRPSMPVRRREALPSDMTVYRPQQNTRPHQQDQNHLQTSNNLRASRDDTYRYLFPSFQTDLELRRDSPLRDPSNGTLGPGDCAEDQRYFYKDKEWIQSYIMIQEGVEIDQHHDGVTHPCQTHVNPLRQTGELHPVCAICSTLALKHIAATQPKLRRRLLWPLCRTCGNETRHKLIQDRKGDVRCRCGRGWMCHMCRIEAFEASQARMWGEAEIRFVNDGACRCGGSVIDGTVRDLICAGCGGIELGGWCLADWHKRKVELTELRGNWT